MKINRDTLHVKLEHLKDEEILSVIEKYYKGVKIQDILNEYKIDIRNNQLFAIFPLFDAELSCEYCNTPMLAKALSKSDYNYKNKGKQFDIFCPSCDHTITRSCHCEGCLDKIEKENYLKYKNIIDNALFPYSQFKDHKLDENELTLRQRFFISVLLRSTYDVRRQIFISLSKSEYKIFPDNRAGNVIIKDFLESGIIYPFEPKSNQVNSNGDLVLQNLEFQLNVEPFDGNTDNLYNRLRYVDSDVFTNDKDFCLGIMHIVFRYEILDYIRYYANKNHIVINISPENYRLLDEYACKFSIAQMYNLIWNTINTIVRFKVQNTLKYEFIEQIFFTILGNKSKHDDIKNYNRIREIGNSVISNVFFKDILKLEIDGFDINIYEYIENIDSGDEFNNELLDDIMEVF